MYRVLKNAVSVAHECIKGITGPGGKVVDGTVGNGQDTLFLANLVSPGGIVYGFDIQEEALSKAAVLIANNGYEDIVRLYKAGHEDIKEYISIPIDAAVFNLGYLPGGNKEVITQPDTTLRAVRQSLDLLKPGGIICIVVYTGHTGGDKEQKVLEEYSSSLDKGKYCVGKFEFLNRKKAPYLLIIEKSLNYREDKQ